MVLSRKWFYRLLLSYLPLLLIGLSVMLVLFFWFITEVAQREARNSAEMVGRNMLSSLDAYIQTLDQLMVKEMISGEWMKLYFYPAEAGNKYFNEYKVSNALITLKNAIPHAESIYLYRFADRMAISPNESAPLRGFHDRAFLETFQGKGPHTYWLEKRSYSSAPEAEVPKQVISIVREYPLHSGGQGLFVVNVNVETIPTLIGAGSLSQAQYLHITDRSGAVLYDRQGALSEPAADSKWLFRIKSDYTGWKIASGIQPDMIRIAETFAYTWMGASLAAILSGLAWMIYAARRNYRPIASIMNRIRSEPPLPASDSGKDAAHDEFSVIESTLQGLMEHLRRHRLEENKHQLYRKRNLFFDLMLGHRVWDGERLQQELRSLSLGLSVGRSVVMVVEIDQYHRFVEDHSDRDQELFKYVLQQALIELAQEAEAPCWAEWVKPGQLTAIVAKTPRADATVHAQMVGERLRHWLSAHVRFTVTIGISEQTEAEQELPYAYSQALKALNFKPSLGCNRLIPIHEIDPREKEDLILRLQSARQLAQLFRLGDEAWIGRFRELFDNLLLDTQDKAELVNLLHYVLYCLNKEIAAMPKDFHSQWHLLAGPLAEKIDQFELLEEIRGQFEETLQQAHRLFVELRRHHPGHEAVRLARLYLHREFADSALSLTQVSDQLGINSSFLSRIFREETGENFLDYLTRIRISEAQRLLLQTDESVQTIAQQVGYLHAASFIRVFKKATGFTPGDYRKMGGSPGDGSRAAANAAE